MYVNNLCCTLCCYHIIVSVHFAPCSAGNVKAVVIATIPGSSTNSVSF